MAITTTTISLASGYGRTDVIQQLEQGFAYLQWHQATASGIVFFKKDISDSATYPWAVARIGIDTSKEYGTTFYGFQMISDTNMVYKVGSSFYPNDANSSSTTKDRMGGYGNRFAGNRYLDLGHTPVTSSEY